MILKRSFLLLTLSVMALCAFADNFSLTKQEQNQILEEAENWIDDMPEGIQNRLWDAISHSMQGFNSELEYLRNSYKEDSSVTGVMAEDFNAGYRKDIPMRLYFPENTKDKTLPVLVYFHGGGWSLGSISIADKFCRSLASKGNLKVISVEYPLAPEKTYSQALQVCGEALEYVFKEGDTLKIDKEKISLGGDGAGGILALDTYGLAAEGEISEIPVEALVLYYPLLHLNQNLDSGDLREYGRGYGLDSRLWDIFFEAAKKESIDSYPSSLPQTLLISSGRDIIIQEEKTFSSRYPNVEYVEFEGAIHGFITDGAQNTAFNKAVELTDLFLTRK